MDYQVAWSPEAIGDVESIASYIARDSRFYAAAVVQAMLDAARTLEKFPFRGRIVPEIAQDDIRERFVYSYRLIYRIREDKVTIAAVIHGKRMLNPVTDRITGR
ncbi:MAG: type II toxin-antitoxin system RelE/ParE family toxin [Gammaproteobacteria bacterium]|nr:MAG: type II toxin-antitoxin system RelE/ParE family toxin [Gammaproteobacteria bacterium]